MVSVPFHQTLRSSCPVFTVIVYKVFFGRSYSLHTLLSLVPIVFGVCLATYGDYDYTWLGFSLTILGVVLAAVKTIATNQIMTGSLKLPVLEVLLLMAPLAAVQALAIAMLRGEHTRLAELVNTDQVSRSLAIAVIGNGLLAVLLNISSFQTNKLAGALTLNVCGNIKQCLTILIGIVAFNVRIGFTNGFGMLITALGAAYFSMVELRTKLSAQKDAEAGQTPR